MEKSQYNTEIDRLLKKAITLEEKSKLDLKTAQFMNNEAIKLENIIDNHNSLPEEKETAMVKLKTLHRRILIELNEATTEQTCLEKELFILNTAINKGLK